MTPIIHFSCLGGTVIPMPIICLIQFDNPVMPIVCCGLLRSKVMLIQKILCSCLGDRVILMTII